MRKQLSKSEIKDINKEIEENYSISDFFSKKDNLIIEDEVLKKDNETLFFFFEGKLIPTLKLILNRDILKSVTVDAGAIKFVSSGADIMRPGITLIDPEIQEGDFISIKEETHNKPLAIGVSLFSGSKMRNQTSGKVVKTIHYVGDKLWNFP